MLKSLLRLTTLSFITISFVAHSGVVVDSTRHLYKEGAREISANIENKDDTPYLIKSWVEASEGTKDSFFMVTPPLFRLEGKQTNTVRIYPKHQRIVKPSTSLTLCLSRQPAIVKPIKASCSSPFATECASSIVHALFRV